MEESNDQRNAISCHVRILRFGNEIRRNEKHSKDSFDQVFSDMDDYDKYCDGHKDFRNNKTVVTQEKIREKYTKNIDKNDYL